MASGAYSWENELRWLLSSNNKNHQRASWNSNIILRWEFEGESVESDFFPVTCIYVVRPNTFDVHLSGHRTSNINSHAKHQLLLIVQLKIFVEFVKFINIYWLRRYKTIYSCFFQHVILDSGNRDKHTRNECIQWMCVYAKSRGLCIWAGIRWACTWASK